MVDAVVYENNLMRIQEYGDKKKVFREKKLIEAKEAERKETGYYYETVKNASIKPPKITSLDKKNVAKIPQNFFEMNIKLPDKR